MLGIAGETTFTVGSRWPVEDEGLAGMILATGRPARKDDYTTMPGPLGAAVRDDRMVATVGVPIVVDGSIWGFMVAAGRPGKPIPAGTEERLARFTELVATAIANSQANEDLAQLADEQAALRRVATLVAEGAAPHHVFDAVRREIARIFNVPLTVLMRFDPDGMATLVATAGGAMGPVGSRWPVEGDTSAVALVHRTGRAARVDYAAPGYGRFAEAARSEGARHAAAAPVVVDGTLWGAVGVGTREPEPLPADLERRLTKFTELLATAIANAENRAELVSSRARVIAAADGARRRIERDLHDGAQQQLVTLALAMRSTEGRVPTGARAAKGGGGWLRRSRDQRRRGAPGDVARYPSSHPERGGPVAGARGARPPLGRSGQAQCAS